MSLRGRFCLVTSPRGYFEDRAGFDNDEAFGTSLVLDAGPVQLLSGRNPRGGR